MRMGGNGKVHIHAVAMPPELQRLGVTAFADVTAGAAHVYVSPDLSELDKAAAVLRLVRDAARDLLLRM